MIDRNSPVPIYYQLKLFLKQQIEAGGLNPGERLPTELELCEQYNISRAPVRQALMELVREGYIHRRAGQGTFVAGVGAAEKQNPPVILKMLAYDVRWASLLEQAVVEWNAMRPDQQVRLEINMPQPQDFHQLLQTSVVQGQAPDLISIDYVWVASYARAGYLVPLDALDPVWSRELAADLEEPVRLNHTLDGHLYALPVQADVTGMWYRRDWFQAEGLEPPATWDELLALIDYFARPEVQVRWGYQYPIAFPVSTVTGEAVLNLLLPFIWVAGGDVVDEKGRITLDAPPTYQALEFLRQITGERHCLPPAVAEFEWSGIPWLLGQGALPMSVGGTYEWVAIFEEANWDTEEDAAAHLGFIPIPRPTLDAPPIASLGGTSWAILSQSEHQELCVNLLRLAMQSEMNLPFCRENFQISPSRRVNAQLVGAEHPWLSQVVPLMQIARPRPLLVDYTRVSRFVQQMFEQVLWEGAPIKETVIQTVRYLRLLVGS